MPRKQPPQKQQTVLAQAVLQTARLSGHCEHQTCLLSMSRLGEVLRDLAKADIGLRIVLSQPGKLGKHLSTLLPPAHFSVKVAGKHNGVRILAQAWQQFGTYGHQGASEPEAAMPSQAMTAVLPFPPSEALLPLPPLQMLPSVEAQAGSSVQLVDTGYLSTQALQEMCTHRRLAVDCEGTQLSATGRICLVQVATETSCFLFDLVSGSAEDLALITGHIRVMMEHPGCEKVMHDARQDCAALHYQLGIEPTNIFDTQVAHMLIRQGQALQASPAAAAAAASLAGGGRISLNNLLEQHHLPVNDLKQAIGLAMDNDTLFWERRPLPAYAIAYASQDVASLLQLAQRQQAQLQSQASQLVVLLSAASAQAKWPAADRTVSLSSLTGQAGPQQTMELQLTTEHGARQAVLVPCAAHAVSSKPMKLLSTADASEDVEVTRILQILPEPFREHLVDFFRRMSPDQDGHFPRLVELVLDLDMPVILRFTDGSQHQLTVPADLDRAVSLLRQGQSSRGQATGSPFNSKNRAGLDHTLHRISAIRGDGSAVIGLTYRIGRHVEGVADIVLDKLRQLWRQEFSHSQQSASWEADAQAVTPSLLILGPPGRGKTTLLRGIANFAAAADGLRKRVIVCDGSGEITGDGRVPHACIGQARRMPVPVHTTQAAVAMEALQNHNAEVIIMDELGTREEVASSRKLSQQGVGLVATAHAVSLQSIMRNPELNPLVGGLSNVILGDAMAVKRNNAVKTRTERAGSPTFSAVIEMLAPAQLRIYDDTAAAVDALLRGETPASQLRTRCQDGRILVQMQGMQGPAQPAASAAPAWQGIQGSVDKLLTSLLSA